jgi:subtilisin family serine protease
LSDKTLVKYYGTSAWDAYVNQPAAFVIKLAQAHYFATGSGAVVAVLDTGVDLSQPVLANSLVAGYDFTRNIAGGSEMADVDQSTDSILDDDSIHRLDSGPDGGAGFESVDDCHPGPIHGLHPGSE